MARFFDILCVIATISGGGSAVIAGQAQGASVSSYPKSLSRGVSDQSVAALQRLVQTRYREAQESFLLNGASSLDGVSKNPFLIAVDGWNRRLTACADNACRYTELSSQLARLNFALGKNTAPLAGVRLRTGALSLKERWGSGNIAIMPVGDGSVVMVVTTFYAGPGGSGAWDCAGIVATGRLAQASPSRMTIYDEDQPVSFDLSVASATSVKLSANAEDEKRAAKDDGWPAVCSAGTIFGTYRAEPARHGHAAKSKAVAR